MLAELHDLVGQIYQARLSDPEKATTRSEHCGRGVDCVYSRVATADLIRNYFSSPDLAGAEPHEHVVNADAFTTHNLFLDIPGRTHPDEWVSDFDPRHARPDVERARVARAQASARRS